MPSPTIKPLLKFALTFGGFLRALFESKFLRSKNCRVAQQPESKGKLAAVGDGIALQMPRLPRYPIQQYYFHAIALLHCCSSGYNRQGVAVTH
jgi:hypothetical protein